MKNRYIERTFIMPEQSQRDEGVLLKLNPIRSTVKDKRVVIVDDVCTTGASTINAIQAAREAGMTVAAVVCIVEREEAKGRPAVEAAAAGAPFLRLFSAIDVRAEHIRR